MIKRFVGSTIKRRPSRSSRTIDKERSQRRFPKKKLRCEPEEIQTRKGKKTKRPAHNDNRPAALRKSVPRYRRIPKKDVTGRANECNECNECNEPATRRMKTRCSRVASARIYARSAGCGNWNTNKSRSGALFALLRAALDKGNGNDVELS